jgi:hypothetical protein
MTSAEYAQALQQVAAFLAGVAPFDVGAATPQIIFSFSDNASFTAAVAEVGDGNFVFQNGFVDFTCNTQPITLRFNGQLTLSKSNGVITAAAGSQSAQV